MKHFYFLLFYFCFCSAQAETFSTWIASYSLTGGNAAFDADPDNDGLPNGIVQQN